MRYLVASKGLLPEHPPEPLGAVATWPPRPTAHTRSRFAQGEAAAILAVAEATAGAIRQVAAAIQSPGGEQAVQLKVAEKAVEAYAQLAQKNNTMIVPGNMSEVSALVGTAMALMRSSVATPGPR